MKKLLNYSIVLLLSLFILSCGEKETVYILVDNLEKTNEGFITHNGEKFTGGAVHINKREGSVRFIEYFDDGEFIGETRYQTLARLDTSIMVQGEKYRLNKVPNSILNQEGYTKYYKGKYIEAKVPGYWKDGDFVRHGIAKKFDSEGNVIEEVVFVDGVITEDN